MYRALFCHAICASALLFAIDIRAHDMSEGRGEHRWGEHGQRERPHVKARLYDARGTLVGDVLYVDGSYHRGGVVLNVDGVFVFAGFARVGGFGTGQPLSSSKLAWQYPQLAYSGENCTGTPYIYYERGAFRPSAIARVGNTATLYIAKDTQSQRINFGSYVNSMNYEPCSNGQPLFAENAWPVERTIDLTQLHPEPLRIGP
ncbi:hypothetical protein [Caballeronia grimmiae]|uniref:hypothetical protein n=1 Tax=Caballeronia grimmiae TaxID=1071679 RepID=UPI0038BC22E9